MDRDYFHWGATAEIMEIIRKKKKEPGDTQTGRKTPRDCPTRNDEKNIRYECSKANMGPLKAEQKKQGGNCRDRR